MGFVGLVVAVDYDCDDGLLWLVVRYLVAIGFCGGCLFIGEKLLLVPTFSSDFHFSH